MSQSVCILGMGLSGAAAARCVLERGDEVTIYAGGKNAKTLAAAQPFIERGVPVFFDTEEVEGHFDLCVVSPGIPQVSACLLLLFIINFFIIDNVLQICLVL